MWSWAAHNVAEDYKEQGRLLFSFMDTLTWWLQPQMRKQVEKDKANQMPDAENYIDDLRKAGASEEYIAKEMADMHKEQQEKKRLAEISGVPDDDGDDFEVLTAPNNAT